MFRNISKKYMARKSKSKENYACPKSAVKHRHLHLLKDADAKLSLWVLSNDQVKMSW